MSIAMPKLGIRKVAAVGALAVASAGLSVIAVAPAAQAKSAELSYTCTVPVLGDKTFTVVSDTNAPATVPSGKAFTPKVTATVTIPADVAGLISGVLGASSVDGTSVVDTLVNGVTKKVSMTVPSTQIPEGALTVVASGVGAPIKAGNAGSTIKMAASSFSSHLLFKKADGSEALTADVPCTLQSGQNASVDTVKVVKAASRTRATAAYAKARKTLAVTARITSTAKPAGKVSFVVTKNGKKFKTVAGKVNARGVATVKLARVAKGRYVVTAKYLGSANAKPSVGRVTKRV